VSQILVRDRPHSVAEQWAAMPAEEREAFIDSLTEDEAEAFLYEWEIFARPEQLPPDDLPWFGYLALAGRGWGKTRSGAEWVRKRVRQGYRYIALVGETAADVRDVMIEGESGILAVSHPSERPKYEPSKRRLVWPNGAVAICYSGKEPDQLRGPQHDTAWADEIAKWQYAEEAWANLEMGLRLQTVSGGKPQVFITTTPRPIKIIKDFVADPMIVVASGSSYDNIANLAETFIQRVIRKYEGTRLGLQELHANILGDVPGSLWTQDLLDRNRILDPREVPQMRRIVVGVDVAVKKRKNASAASARRQGDGLAKEGTPNETGIVVVGRAVNPKTKKRTIYVLHDESGEYSPEEWGRRAVDVYEAFGASRMVAERNQGGDMIEANIAQECERRGRGMVNFKDVWSSTSKPARAEPVAGEMERGYMKLVGNFAALESQMTSTTTEEYLGPGSPDRMDAMVSGATELLHGSQTSTDPEDYEDYQAA
jgi:phage terminase large subunit-like protein